MRLISSSGSGRPMSRQELAEAVNAYLFTHYQQQANLDETYIGKLERGEHRWPNERYRTAFRSVLRSDNDAGLGFYIVRARTAPASEGDVVDSVVFEEGQLAGY